MRHFVLTTLTLASTAFAQGSTLTLQPTADATTDQSQPTTNLGTSPELSFGKYLGASGASFLRGHVEFDLMPVVAVGRVPVRATFFWNQSRASGAGCLDVTLHEILGPWSESTITWQNQPAHDPFVAARACVGDTFANGWQTFDVTKLVQSWLAGTTTNHGFVVRDPTETAAGAARPGYGHSRENGTAALVPYLEVEFADRFGTGCSARATVPEFDVLRGEPRIGTFLTMRTTNLVVNSNPGMLFGISKTTWNGQSLPLSLDSFGFFGCTLLIAPDWAGTIFPLANTQWDLTFLWPNNPALVNTPLFMQVVVLPPTGGLELSNGLGVTIR